VKTPVEAKVTVRASRSERAKFWTAHVFFTISQFTIKHATKVQSTDRSITRTWLRYVRVFAVVIPSAPSVVCLCVVCVTFVHQGTCTLLSRLIFLALFMPFCTIAIGWPPCKLLRRLSQGNPPSGVNRERGTATAMLDMSKAIFRERSNGTTWDPLVWPLIRALAPNLGKPFISPKLMEAGTSNLTRR